MNYTPKYLTPLEYERTQNTIRAFLRKLVVAAFIVAAGAALGYLAAFVF